MSVIAVTKVPSNWSKVTLVKALSKSINGSFEALDSKVPKYSKDRKICYLCLSEKLDPVHVVEKINGTGFSKIGKLHAFIPRRVPDGVFNAKPTRKTLQQWKKFHGALIDQPRQQEVFNAKPTKKTLQQRKKFHGALIDQPRQQTLITTHMEIRRELQTKYTGLYNLSKKTGHKLMAEISEIVLERLKNIMDTNSEATDCFKLSKCYRKLHPHFGDFQLILSTLHKIQDAEGLARDQVVESELASVSVDPYVIDNIPADKVKEACNKYSERIVKKVNEYIKGYDCEVNETDKEEEIARKRIREEFKKLSLYMPLIVKQVTNKFFVPKKSPYHKIRVYGEPFLPSKEQMLPITRRYRAMKVMRSDRMYNMLQFNIPPDQYTSLMTMDGTVIGGAKLVIRSADNPHYKIPGSLLIKMRAAFDTAPLQMTEVDDDMAVDAEDVEDWDEDIALEV